MKKFDLTQGIPNIAGIVEEQIVPLKKRKVVEGEIIEDEQQTTIRFTLGLMLLHSLLHRHTAIDEQEVLARMDLIDKVNNNFEAEFTPNEISKLKELVIDKFDIFFAGQVIRILNK